MSAATAPLPAAALPRRQHPGLRRLWVLPGVALGCLLAGQGGWFAVLGTLLACGWAVLLAGAGPVRRDDSRHAAAHATSGAALMAQQIVPVWQRQLQTARQSAEEGTLQVLQRLTALTESLAVVEREATQLDLSAAAGSLEDVLQSNAAVLQVLLAPMQRAFAQRDAALSLLQQLREPLSDLLQAAQQQRASAAHTRLVSMNASIEAGRSGSSDAGFKAVAEELRRVADRVHQGSERVWQLAQGIEQALAAALHQGELQRTSGEELHIEAQLQGRQALSLLLAGLGGSLGALQALSAQCGSLQAGFQEVLAGLQFGDRMSQMLTILGDDMQRFAAWVQQERPASQAEAAQWLAELEGHYTMEQQRAHHHGNVHVQQVKNIEFF